MECNKIAQQLTKCLRWKHQSWNCVPVLAFEHLCGRYALAQGIAYTFPQLTVDRCELAHRAGELAHRATPRKGQSGWPAMQLFACSRWKDLFWNILFCITYELAYRQVHINPKNQQTVCLTDVGLEPRLTWQGNYRELLNHGRLYECLISDVRVWIT